MKSSRSRAGLPMRPFGVPSLDPNALRLGPLLGRGGFGSVFAGTFTVRGKTINVAIKCAALDPTMLRPADVWALAKEVSIMRALNHPNITQCYAACFDAASRDSANLPLGCCLVLELATESLRRALDSVARSPDGEGSWLRPWPARERVALDVARGMCYLYDQIPGIFHRDLKAANVLISHDRTAKLSDFGLAKYDEHSRSTKSGLSGSFPWKAPETFRRQPFEQASDVWSFGVVLFEIVTLARPYENYDDHQIMTSILIDRETPNMTLVPESCPTELREAMASCLSFSPSDRPSFAALVRVLPDSAAAAPRVAALLEAGKAHESDLPLEVWPAACSVCFEPLVERARVRLCASNHAACFVCSLRAMRASLQPGSQSAAPRCPLGACLISEHAIAALVAAPASADVKGLDISEVRKTLVEPMR